MIKYWLVPSLVLGLVLGPESGRKTGQSNFGPSTWSCIESYIAYTVCSTESSIGSNTESKTTSDTLSSTSWRILFCSHFYKVKVDEKTSINLLRFNQCSISLQMRILTPCDLFYVAYRSKMLHPKIWPYRSWSYQIVRLLNTDLKLNKWSGKSNSKVKILESVRIDH